MNAGAPGFQGAPVTKALLLAAGLASLVAAGEGGAPIVRGLAFRTPTQALFGLGVLYHARTVERLLGPAKYGAHACLAAALTGGSAIGLAFAALAGLAAAVPPTAHFRVAGLPLTDKAFLAAAAAQLLVAGGAAAVVPAAAGAAVAALLHWQPALAAGVDTPPAAQAALGRLLAPVLGGKHHSRIVVPASATVVGAGRHGGGGGPGLPRRGHAARGPPAEPAPAAVQQLVAMGFSADRARAALRQAGGSGGDDVQAALAVLLA